MVILRKSWPRQPNPGTTHGNSEEILAILVSWGLAWPGLSIVGGVWPASLADLVGWIIFFLK